MHRLSLRPALSFLLLAMFAWGDLGAPLADATAFHRIGPDTEVVQVAPGGATGAARHFSACQLDTPWGTARTPVPAASGAVVPPAVNRVRGVVETLTAILPRRPSTCRSRAPPVTPS